MNPNMMTDSDTRRYDGVLSARVVAFIIDYTLLGLLMVPIWIIYMMVGMMTLGLGFLIAPIPFVVVAALYFGLTLGGPRQASIGMRVAGLRISRDNGEPVDFVTAIAHQVLFWAFNAFLSPLVVLIGIFTNRNRLLHDMVMGTVMHRP